jgi:BASS family bile acid:Na+ symporter
MDYARAEYGLTITQAMLAMFGIGATLSVGDFMRVARRPRPIALTAGLQFVAAPLVVVLAAWVFDLSAGIALGLVLVASMPGGAYSNIICYLGRGNVPLSVSLTAVSTALCLLATPIVLRVFAAGFLPVDFVMPVRGVVLEILLCLLLPILSGMALRRLAPRHYGRISLWSIRASLLLLSIIVLGALAAGRVDPGQYRWTELFVLLAFAVISFRVSNLGCRLAGLNRDDAYTVGVEVLVRNGNLALVTKAVLFPAVAGQADLLGDSVLFVILVYSGLVFAVSAPATIVRHRARRAAELPAHSEGLPPKRERAA